MTAAPTPWWTRRPGLAALCTLVVAAGAYLPFLQGAWVWDDRALVAGNAALASPGGLSTLLAHDLFGAAGMAPGDVYRPVAVLTQWAQVRLHGMSLPLLRLGNLALWGAAAWTLGAWLRRAGLGAGAALTAALLWALHPLGVEPTLWVSGRHDLLASLGVFAALALWPRGGERWGLRVALASAACLGAFLSKETAVVAPLLVALDALRRRCAGESLPAPRSALLGPVGAVAAGFVLRAWVGVGSGSALWAGGVAGVVRTAGSVLLAYLPRMATLTAGPTVACWQPRPLTVSALALAATGLAATALWARAWRGRDAAVGWVALGWSMSLTTLAPVALALPATGLVGNRYGHLPAAGLLVAVVAWASLRGVARMRRGLMVGLVGAALLASLGGVVDEAASWRDDVALFGRAVAMAPRDGCARYHYGVALGRRGGCAAALSQYEAATAWAPGYARGWHNRAGCLLRLGRPAEALAAARRAAALDPTRPGAAMNVALAHLALGDTDAGRRWLDRVLVIDPRHAEARARRAALGP